MNPDTHIVARYHITAGSAAAARELAADMAREQTLEVPPAAAPAHIEEGYLGRVRSVAPVRRSGAGSDPDAVAAVPTRWEVELAYSPDLLDGSLTQLLNLVWGNISLMPAVRLVELELPDPVVDGFPGPGLGIRGLRRLVGAGDDRPLISGALKPVGLSPEALAGLAARLTAARMDLIKDDHSLVDQAMAPFRERILRVSDSVATANARTGGATAYFPNITGSSGVMLERAARVREAGCRGAVISPGLCGLPAMLEVREAFPDLAIMAHPSHANASPGAPNGIAPEVLMGMLWRMAGADALIYVNAHGRFAWPVEVCREINARARGPMGALRPAFPVPAGGVQADRVPHWVELYGPDTLLLVGGSILEAEDVEARASEVVAAIHAGAGRGARVG
jgi:ribulose-bisphosphate carboxylase large chain